ncbi:cathepsin S,-like 1 isoform X2 [Silurus meridionalis]|nr:cathepsin S,-like 1 isoform X2 [Silurus meridionalis]
MRGRAVLMMRVLLALLLSGVCCDVKLDDSWWSWKSEFNKNYKDVPEEAYRRSVWEQNVLTVMKHNEEADAGLHTFTTGLNHLSDMTAEEVNAKLNGLRMGDFSPQDDNHDDNLIFQSYFPLPPSVNWTEDAFVTPVQDQGDCNSCWAFSAVGALEAQMKKKKGVLVPLSVQQLVDCSHATGNQGCFGGLPTNAFDYIINNKGISTEFNYPYKHKVDLCNNTVKKYGVCKGFRVLQPYNEYELQRVVATIGPVVVGIEANTTEFHQYHSGVFSGPCNSIVNHAVLVVGYGKSEEGLQYWLVKNSWSDKWGEGGYMRILRNKNQCGIGIYSVVPLI